MKKSILFITALIAITALMAVALQKETKVVPTQATKQVSSALAFDDNFVDFMNKSKIPNIVFNVNSRFVWEITQQDVVNAKSIEDLFPDDAMQGVRSVEENRVTTVGEVDDVTEWGSGVELNQKQQMLLKTLDYSNDFYVEGYVINDDLTRRKIVYFFSIVPEQQAKYEDGIEELNSYLENESRSITSDINQDRLKPGRISFTISEKGEIKDLKKTSTSGYEDLDEKMLQTLKNLPKSWKPASNTLGETVEQTLFLFFGIQGC